MYSLAEIRDRSAIAFGQSYRLEVMIAVAEAGDRLICLTDLARELGVQASNIQKPLKALLQLGLLTLPPSGDSRKKYYIRNPSAAWRWAYEMAGVTPGSAVEELRALAES